MSSSPLAVAIFFFFVGSVLGLSFWLGRKAQSAKGYYAAHGQIPWFVNGVAFAGDYLSAASFLGICGIIAFYGYDGFLYSIGYLAGWVVALFVVAEPLKRLGKFTFADALDARFHSRGIKVAAAISALVVSVFYLIPQMVGAGALIKPLLGLDHTWGVLIVGVVVTIIVATAGMVSTTWVQFIKGSLLVVFCAILTVMILAKGLNVTRDAVVRRTGVEAESLRAAGEKPWAGKPFLRVAGADGAKAQVWKIDGEDLVACRLDGAATDAGTIAALSEGKDGTGAVGPLAYLGALQHAQVVTWKKDALSDAAGAVTAVYSPVVVPGSQLLTPGQWSTFSGIRGDLPVADPANPESVEKRKKALYSRIDFLSLMLALFCGTASLPHILIRYYTVKDARAARRSTVVGIATIGFFYVLTLFIGLAAMTSGARSLDASGSNLSAPLLAKTFGELPFAIISAIAFTTVLGTVSGLIMAASGAIVHDLMTNFLKLELSDERKVHWGKIVSCVVGALAMVLGILFKDLNATFLVGWAFNIAASANLPALVMLLFWRGTTKQGITWAIIVGLTSSLGWVLLSKDALEKVYHFSAADAAAKTIVPWSQPGILTIPLGFLVLIVVSLLTRRRGAGLQTNP
jgi:cation/acetate symporter